MWVYHWYYVYYVSITISNINNYKIYCEKYYFPKVVLNLARNFVGIVSIWVIWQFRFLRVSYQFSFNYVHKRNYWLTFQFLFLFFIFIKDQHFSFYFLTTWEFHNDKRKVGPPSLLIYVYPFLLFFFCIIYRGIARKIFQWDQSTLYD